MPDVTIAVPLTATLHEAYTKLHPAKRGMLEESVREMVTTYVARQVTVSGDSPSVAPPLRKRAKQIVGVDPDVGQQLWDIAVQHGMTLAHVHRVLVCDYARIPPDHPDRQANLYDKHRDTPPDLTRIQVYLVPSNPAHRELEGRANLSLFKRWIPTWINEVTQGYRQLGGNGDD